MEQARGLTVPEVNGKIFMDLRQMNLDDIPGAEGFVHFLWFLDKYVSCNMGAQDIKRYLRRNRNKTLIDFSLFRMLLTQSYVTRTTRIAGSTTGAKRDLNKL